VRQAFFKDPFSAVAQPWPMTIISCTKVAAAARIVGLAAVLSAVTGSAVAFAGAADAARDGMHGDPGAAASYWRYQQEDYDCGEMAVADVVGQISGREPTEQQITATAGNIPSVSHPGPIYRPSDKTKNSDLPVLLAHYGIQAVAVHTTTDGLAQDLDQGHKVIVGLNDRTIWNKPGDRTRENHFVVVTGIDTKAGVLHLNDSGSTVGRDEQVPIAIFGQAWATSDNFAVVTR
jgi:Peptidase_C39 like family